MSGNISEVSASLSSNSDIVPDKDVELPRPGPEVRLARLWNPGSNNNIDKTVETTFLVATLIATVTFAAGFTMPGGTVQDGENQGSPILKHNLAFQIFVITDCTALVLSASAVLIYLVTTVDEVRKNQKRYISYAKVATRLTMLAMVSMIISFLAGIYAVLGVGDSNSIGVVTLLIGLSFFLVIGILLWKSDKNIREK